jgi:NTE family protein
MAVAFVLSGGGGLAAAQVGVLQALTEAGIVPDLVVGSSAGAINAVAFAQDPTPAGLDRMATGWVALSRRDVFPLRPDRVAAAIVGGRGGLSDPSRLARIMTAGLPATELQDAVIPVHVVASALTDGSPVVLSRGPVVRALLASIALPGVYPPVTIGGAALIDGQVAAGCPIRQAEELGATESYAVPTLPTPDAAAQPTRGAPAIFARALAHLFAHNAGSELAAAGGRVHLLAPPRPPHTYMTSFDSSAALITAGYEHTARLLRAERSSMTG